VVVVMVVEDVRMRVPRIEHGHAHLPLTGVDLGWANQAAKVIRAHAFAKEGLWRADQLPRLKRNPHSTIESFFLRGLLAHANLKGLRAAPQHRQTANRRGASTDPLCCRAVALIRDRCAEPQLRATDIAEAEGISAWTLSIRLRATGKTFPQHLHDARIDLARPLVETSSASINAIASKVGYTRPGDLSYRYRERHGMSPNRWRQLHRSSRPVDDAS
jgi:AraC-like DNA-binding protein